MPVSCHTMGNVTLSEPHRQTNVLSIPASDCLQIPELKMKNIEEICTSTDFKWVLSMRGCTLIIIILIIFCLSAEMMLSRKSAVISINGPPCTPFSHHISDSCRILNIFITGTTKISTQMKSEVLKKRCLWCCEDY